MWADPVKEEDDSSEESSEEESSEEESSEDEAAPKQNEQEMTREERRAAAKAKKDAAIKKKQGTAQPGDLPPGSSDEESDDDDAAAMPSNPNHTASARKMADAAKDPAKAKEPAKVKKTTDPSQLSRREREALQAQQAKERYQKMHAEGKTDEASSEWLSGFFDKGSFQETLSGWAQTVVVGRARLGGIPMGVIAVETRTIERVIPADPANPASFEQRIMEAGQVWYPNSAYKTAQAIFDFNREGLPLIIFANWRGFSGGQQDMYDEVLKQGSKIVDGLSAYKQPVFVYIVPNGELRGGAWVVLDPSINAEGQMEMYADVEARAGVLEPEGIIEIKMRRDKIVGLMDRLDSQYAQLKKDSKDPSKTPEEIAATVDQLEKRETLLQPTYKQIALLYADLHE